MPNFDAGSYFLTTLAPVQSGSTTDAEGATVSWEERLRTVLAQLPTAMQSPATVETGQNSPFARNRRTHLCRFVVIDNVIDNGRPQRPALLNSIFGRDPIYPLPVDRLGSAYLLFTAEIDALTEEGGPLPATLTEAEQNAVRAAYAETLRATMEPEVRRICGCCVGFDTVTDGAGFARYLARAQVETTMPFHDYWIDPPNLPQLPVIAMGAAVVVPLLLTLGSLLGFVLGWTPWLWLILGILGTAGAVAWAYRLAMRRGEAPLPPPAFGDLPTVLKSLYLQQQFIGFAGAHQSDDAAALHAAFGAFLGEHKPDDTSAPTQAPGHVSSAMPGAVVGGGQS